MQLISVVKLNISLFLLVSDGKNDCLTADSNNEIRFSKKKEREERQMKVLICKSVFLQEMLED